MNEKIKLYFVGIFILFTSSLFANDCEVLKVTKDDFGKTTRHLTVGGSTGFSAQHVPSSMKIIDETESVEVVHMFCHKGVIDKVIGKGSKILIALDNGEILTFATSIDIEPVGVPYGQFTYTKWDVVTQINNSNLSKLATSPIKAIKVTFEGIEIINNRFSKRDKKKVLSAFSCLNKQLNE